MEQQHEVIDLRDYARMLWRRKWTVVVTTIIVVGLAMALTLTQTPLYTATTDLAIEPVRRAQDAQLEEILFGNTVVETERRVLTSAQITDDVIQRVGLTTSSRELLKQVSVTSIRDTRVLQISVTDESAERAAEISVAYAEAYLDQRRANAVNELLAAQESLNGRVAALRGQVANLNRLLLLEGEASVEGQSLVAQRDGVITQLGALSIELANLGSSQDLVRGGGQILNPAEVPGAPSSPKPLRTGVLAIVLGGMLGVGGALLRDYLDDAIRSDDDLKRAMGGLPVLGRIPHWEDGNQRRVVSLLKPSSVISESYRTLRTNVRFLLASSPRKGGTPGYNGAIRAGGADVLGGPGKTILITSATAGEGKTSTVTNLAVTFARAGQRVVLVDGDMRKPRVADMFAIPVGSSGLSDAISGLESVSNAIHDVGVDNLRVITSGPRPPNPAELLGSPGMRALQYDLERQFDVVLIDSPPVLSVADAMEVAPYAHGTILVATAGRASRRAVHAAVEAIQGVGAVLAGGVLNDITEQDAYYGYQYYYKDYVEDTGAPTTAPRKLFNRKAQEPEEVPPDRRRRAGSPTDRSEGAGSGAIREQDLFPSTTPERGDRPTTTPERLDYP